MGDIGFSEILLIGIVILVFFGGKKIPEFMRGLGNGVREFNEAKDNVRRELENGMKEKDQAKPTVTSSSTIQAGNTPSVQP